MQYTQLGNTGLTVSRLCLGMMSYGAKSWREYVLEEDDAMPMIRYAVEQGMNFLDTANMYSLGVSEEITGKAVKAFCNRDEVVVATKVFFPFSDKPNMGGLSRKHIMSQLDASLKRLDMDYIDLYQIHRWDYNTPIEETMEALHDVVKAGKVRYIGASSMYAWQFAKAQHIAQQNGWTRFVSMQNHYNLVYREEEREMIPLCVDQGVGLIPWSPLARGFLAGNYQRGDGGQTVRGKTDDLLLRYVNYDDNYTVVERVAEIAEKYGHTPAQIALAWLFRQPGVTAPIVGASKQHHLEQTIAALDITLDDDDAAYLEAAYQPKPILGHS